MMRTEDPTLEKPNEVWNRELNDHLSRVLNLGNRERLSH